MKKTALLFLALTASIFSQGISRLEKSPYPSSSQPDTLYRLTDSSYDQAQLLTIGTLQGLLARTEPKLYRINAASYDIWLTDLKNKYGVTVITEFDNSFAGIIDKFKDSVEGYVICNLNDNSVNVAISMCGITNCVAVTAAYKNVLDSLGIPMYMDVRSVSKDEFWFFGNYGSQINKNIFIFQNETKSSFLADYSVFGKMITVYNSSFIAGTNRIFDSFNSNAATLGWKDGDEYGIVDYSSKYDVYVHAADWANNLSALSNFNAPEFKQPDPPVKPDKKNVHTVCFLMTDGDNIQWVLGDFFTSSKWYSSTRRGKTSMGWTMAPALSELAPTVLKKFYDLEKNTSIGRDHFVAGPSGVGYIFPDKYKDLAGYSDLTNAYMKKADIGILNILGNNDADMYLSPFMTQPNIDAIFYYFYSDYSGGAGKIKWVNNKPVIYGRYNLWDLFESPTSLAAKLNNLSTDVTSPESYSLIPVHVWSIDMDAVMNCVIRLDDDVQVVAPDEFVALIKKNVMQRSEAVNFIPDNSDIEKEYLLPEYAGTGYDSLSRWADNSDKIVYRFNLDNLMEKCGGSKNILLSFNISHEYVISIGDSLENAGIYAKWNSDSADAHTDSNKVQYSIDIEEYINKGWENFYLIFEDGMKSDAYGPVIYNITIKAPQTIGIEEEPNAPSSPKNFSLDQNYPNPFNPETVITYNIHKAGNVKLNIYDSLGRLVKTLVNSFQQQGESSVVWDGRNNNGQKVSSGVYIYKLNANGMTDVKKMTMLK